LESFLRDSQLMGKEILEWAIFEKYPDLRKLFDNDRLIDIKAIKNFISSKYQEENKIIRSNLDIYKINWQKVEKHFLVLTDKIIGSSYWPKGKYIAYPSIWGMFPRFLDDKTFQFPYQCKTEKYVNVIIAHEMLHFIFFNYFFQKYPKYKNNKYDSLVWNVSEIFNVVIQNSPEWIKFFKLRSISYPAHEKIINKLNKKYHKKDISDVDMLIRDVIKELQ